MYLSMIYVSNMCICLSIYLSIHLPIYRCIYLSNISICLCIYLSIYLIDLPIHPSIHPSIHLSISLSVCLSIYLSLCLIACLSVYLSIYLSVYCGLDKFLAVKSIWFGGLHRGILLYLVAYISASFSVDF